MTESSPKPERVVILCGGRGYRMEGETDVRPKPMIPIGDRPVLWHIMKIYSHYGYNRFVLCLGYKGDAIRDYFLRYHEYTQDFIVRLGERTEVEHQAPSEEKWEIVLAETGINTTTGGRMLAIRDYLDTPCFLMTYGDGVSNVNLEALMAAHREAGRLATMTAVPPASRFGEVDFEGDLIRGFSEKPAQSAMRINGGFFVLERETLDYIHGDEFFEAEPMTRLAAAGQLTGFLHEGFWECMDTPTERDRLNARWRADAPWAIWAKEEQA
jgi:glucose-1-phosphate cytidylyltransferase